MTTATYPITSTYRVIFSPGQPQPSVGLQNAGTTAIYIDSTPQLSSTQGRILNPSATTQWDAGVPLYAVTPDPAGGSLNVLWDQTVTYFDPTSLAAAINLVGVPAIDQPKVILNYSKTVADNAVLASSTIVDVSRYTSIVLRLNEAGATDTPNFNIRDIQLVWYADAAGTIEIARDKFSYWPYQGQVNAIYQCNGAFVQLVSSQAPNTGATSTVTITMIGTTRNLVESVNMTSGKNGNQIETQYNVYDKILILSGSCPGGGSFLFNAVYSWSGTATLEANTQDSPNPADIFAWDVQVAQYSSSIQSGIFGTAAGGPGGESRNVTFPAVPIIIQIFNTNPGALTFNIAIVWD